MAVDKQYQELQYDIIRGTYNFGIPWPLHEQDDIVVRVTTPTGDVIPVPIAEYVLSPDSSTLTLMREAVDSYYYGQVLFIARYTNRTQELHLNERAPIHPSALETTLDRLEYQIQELDDTSVSQEDLQNAVEILEEADAELSARIDAESAIRAQEDASIRQAIADEDAAIRADLATERDERIAGDLDNRTRLDTEITNRINGDNNLQSQVNIINNRVDDLSRLGRNLGTVAKISDLPQPAPPESTPGDFVIVTEGPNTVYNPDGSVEQYIPAQYIIDAIAQDGMITWRWVMDMDPNISNKIDKVPTALQGNLAEFDGGGEVVDSGLASSRVVLRPIDGVVGEFVALTDTGELTTTGLSVDTIMHRVNPVTSGDVAVLTDSGQVADSGTNINQFMRLASPAAEGNILLTTSLGQAYDSGIDIGSLSGDLSLPLTGGTMSGNIDMDTHAITNLADPVIGGDAVNLKTLLAKVLPSVPTDGEVYGATVDENGLPVWQNVDDGKRNDVTLTVYTQPELADTWVVDHGMGIKIPYIRVYNDEGNIIRPMVDLEASTVDSVTLKFYEPITGIVYLFAGFEGLYVENFDSAQVWQVNHNLASTAIIVDVVDTEYNEVVPDIKILNSNSIQLTFYAPVKGTVSVFASKSEQGSSDIFAAVPHPALAATWDVAHGLGTEHTLVQVYDHAGVRHEPINPILIDLNTIRLTFRSAIAGTAYVYASRRATGSGTLPGPGSSDAFPSLTDSISMPSASGSTYIAPDNGWVQVQGTSTTTSAWGLISAGQLQIARSTPTAGIPIADFLPVTKGTTVTIAYSGMDITAFNFVPTEG